MAQNGGARPGSGRKNIGNHAGALLSDVHFLMIYNRAAAMRYLASGTEINLPPKLKRHLDELEAASARGELKATREILDRCLGKPLQNVELNVSDRKLIADDTAQQQLSPGTPLARAAYRIIEAEKTAQPSRISP